MYIRINPTTIFFVGFVAGVVATLIVKGLFTKK